MANVFQMIATNREHPRFEESIVNSDFHISTSSDEGRTLCGIQLDGDDGVAPGETIQGVVTCPSCYGTIEEIKAIKKWRW